MNDDNLHHIAAARLRRAREPRHDREYTLAEIDAKEQQDADDLARGIRQIAAESRQRQFAKTQPDVYYPACDSGPCQSGKKICPTPAACRVPEAGLRRITLRIAAAAFVALVVFLIGWFTWAK